MLNRMFLAADTGADGSGVATEDKKPVRLAAWQADAIREIKAVPADGGMAGLAAALVKVHTAYKRGKTLAKLSTYKADSPPVVAGKAKAGEFTPDALRYTKSAIQNLRSTMIAEDRIGAKNGQPATEEQRTELADKIFGKFAGARGRTKIVASAEALDDLLVGL